MIYYQSFQTIIVYYLIRFIDRTGISDYEVAANAQISRSLITGWRKTGYGNPEMTTVDKILKALNVRAVDFIYEIVNDILSENTGKFKDHNLVIGKNRDRLMMEFARLLSKMDFLEK